MKRQRDQQEVHENAESFAPPPEPFNLFAGVKSEPLEAPTTLPQSPTPSPQQEHSGRTPAEREKPHNLHRWSYVAIAIAALVIGVIIGLAASR